MNWRCKNNWHYNYNYYYYYYYYYYKLIFTMMRHMCRVSVKPKEHSEMWMQAHSHGRHLVSKVAHYLDDMQPGLSRKVLRIFPVSQYALCVETTHKMHMTQTFLLSASVTVTHKVWSMPATAEGFTSLHLEHNCWWSRWENKFKVQQSSSA